MKESRLANARAQTGLPEGEVPAANAEPEAYPLPWSAGRVFLAVCGGVLVVLSFPLFGDRYHLDHLVWVALVPLFLAARGAGARRGFLLGWLAGMCLECCGFVWILFAIRSFWEGISAPLASLVFVCWLLYSSIPWGALGWALGRCRTSSQILWIAPFWIGVEHYFPRLFPWHLGGALYARSWLLQCADIVGVSGLTALVFLVSAAVYRLVLFVRARGGFPLRTVAAAATLLVISLVYGALRLENLRELEARSPRLRVGFVQGNIDPRQSELATRELDIYLERTEKLLASEGDLDLVVWPEGVNPYPFVLSHPRAPLWHFMADDRGPGMVERLRDFPVPLVAGGGAVEYRGEGEDEAFYNVAFYVRQGSTPVLYKKNNRVPFGENVPLPRSLRKKLGLTFVGNLTAGTRNPLCELKGFGFRNLICYEAVLPGYVRRIAPGADFAVNITEDVWYGDTAHVPQHLSVLILCSVESRLPVVRSTNVGPSGVVGITGEFRGSGKIFAEDRFVEEIAPVRVTTLYQRGGYLFPLLSLLLGVGYQWRLGRREK